MRSTAERAARTKTPNKIRTIAHPGLGIAGQSVQTDQSLRLEGGTQDTMSNLSISDMARPAPPTPYLEGLNEQQRAAVKHATRAVTY